MTQPHSDLYAPTRVKKLFDEMSKTYGLVNLLSSLGFAARWRRQCVERAAIRPGDRVCDLMTGMGECLPLVHRQLASGEVGNGIGKDTIGVDFSAAMCRRARSTAARLGWDPSEAICEQDALRLSLGDGSVDRVVSAFGLKTMAPDDLRDLARQVRRVLRPGGRFSFVEISEPRSWILRLLYLPYIRFCVPLLGAMLLGNPDNYRQLGIYTERFGDCTAAGELFAAEGLEVEVYSLFFGCATGIAGAKLS